MKKAKDIKPDQIRVHNAETGDEEVISLDEWKKRQDDAQAAEKGVVEPTEAEKPDYSQDKNEVAEMVDFYKAQFNELYTLTCLNCERVIGVEVAPVRADGVVLDKGRTLYTYKDLCLSARRRGDLNENNQPMYGYQCACGNSTLIAQVEKGHVAERTIVKDREGKIVHDSGPIAAASPFERAQKLKAVQKQQAKDNTKADYETDGNMERYETFKLERVK
jgi:hypothetical protein